MVEACWAATRKLWVPVAMALSVAAPLGCSFPVDEFRSPEESEEQNTKPQKTGGKKDDSGGEDRSGSSDGKNDGDAGTSDSSGKSDDDDERD